MKNVFVKNLPFESTREDVKKLFETFGTVGAVTIQTKKKGKSRGFGFVFMPDEAQADKAIAQLDGKDFMGRPLSVTRVIPKAAHKPKPASKRHSRHDERPTTFRGEERPSRPSKPWVAKTSDKPKVWDAKSNAAPKRPEAKPKAWGRDAGDPVKPFKKSAGHAKPWISKISTAPKSFHKDAAPSKGTKTWEAKGPVAPKPFGKDKAKAWGRSAGPAPKPFKKPGVKFTGNKTINRNKGNA